jgi:hypothetical protein
MKATYGFRATMTANFASQEAQAFLAKLVPLVMGDARYQDEVPVGGKLHGGGAR